MRNRFLVGAGDTYSVDDTGGTLTHAHTYTDFGHSHAIPAGALITANPGGAADTSTDTPTGTFDPSSSLPPYHSLVLVMYDGRPI